MDWRRWSRTSWARTFYRDGLRISVAESRPVEVDLLGWQRSGDGLKAARPRTIRSIVCGPRPASRPFRRGETAGRHRIDAAR